MTAVYRNAGGRVSPDVVRTVNTLRSLMYNSEKATVMVVHHTGKHKAAVGGISLCAVQTLTTADCGMTHLSNDKIRDDVVKRDVKNHEHVAGFDFGCFTAEDLEKVILEDVEALKAEDLLRGVEVRGFVLTTETGVLREL